LLVRGWHGHLQRLEILPIEAVSIVVNAMREAIDLSLEERCTKDLFEVVGPHSTSRAGDHIVWAH